VTVRRGLLWFLLVALVAVQALGLVHRIAHGDHAPSASGFSAPGAAHAGVPAPQWDAGLFGGHEDDGGCLLYDQLSHGGFLPVPAPATLPVLAPAFLLQWFQGGFLARWAALFDARGPPPIR
jgi:hypothetical protein